MDESSVVSRIAHESCLRAAPLIRRGHWWEELDADFAKRPEAFDLALADRVKVGAAAGFDTVLRTFGASMISSMALPLGYNPIELRRAVRDADLYADIAESGDPKRFFAEPPSGVRVRAEKGRWLPRFEPSDGTCEAISFDSPFQPVNPAQHKRYLRHGANRVAHARLLRHRGNQPRPTIVAIHGFTADWYLINEWFFALPWFYRMGCNVALFTLPFHGPRQTRFSPFSGHGYFAGGASRLNEAVAQSVFDFRILFDWLRRERGAEQIGVTGLSLGGFTTAMLASVEDRLAFAIPNVPVVSLADLVLEWQPIGWLLRGALLTKGMGLQDVRRMVAVSCPLSYAPVLPPERLMIVGGVGDRLAPPKHSRLLWDHWGRCRIHWFPGSHIIHMDRGVYLTEMARFMVGRGFLPQGELPPAH
ncbi:MAG: alpha/beta hydrolase family protein [Polyangiales bacterium]